MRTLRDDLASALRQLRARPGLACSAVATLALAIGLNAAVWSLVNGQLLRPLPGAVSTTLVSHLPLTLETRFDAMAPESSTWKWLPPAGYRREKHRGPMSWR